MDEDEPDLAAIRGIEDDNTVLWGNEVGPDIAAVRDIADDDAAL